MKKMKKICIIALACLFCLGTAVFASWNSVTTLTVPKWMGQASTISEYKSDGADVWSWASYLITTDINTALYKSSSGTQASYRLSVPNADEDMYWTSYYGTPANTNYYLIINSQTSNLLDHTIGFRWTPDDAN